MKYWQLEIDGPDKTGKDLLCSYLCQLGGYKYSINVRGIISQLVYNIKFNRGLEYDLSVIPDEKVFILLTADPEDIKVRCKVTDEPDYPVIEDDKLFKQVASELSNEHHVIVFNTTKETPYNIAKQIIEYLEKLEQKG